MTLENMFNKPTHWLYNYLEECVFFFCSSLKLFYKIQSAESYLYLFRSAASDLFEELGICFVLFYLGLYHRISVSRKPA